VSLDLVLGMGLALVMHRVLFLHRTLRAAVLVPYAVITMVAALAWKLAFDPVTGFVNPWLGVEHAWPTERWSAFVVTARVASDTDVQTNAEITPRYAVGGALAVVAAGGRSHSAQDAAARG
jgi:ABC-type sugar transport system permease subunit